MHIRDPSSAVDFDESPEGHALRFDESGKLVGVTIVGARALLAAEREIKITIREVMHLASGDVAPALIEA